MGDRDRGGLCAAIPSRVRVSLPTTPTRPYRGVMSPRAISPDAMRVTMLVRNTFSHDTRVEAEARSLAGAGYEVTVVADAATGRPEREERDGYHVVRVGRAAPSWPGIRFVATDRRFERSLPATRPHVLHAHDTNALAPVATAARQLGIPFVYDAHDLWTGRASHGRSPLYLRASNAYFRSIERRWLPAATGRITVSPPLARYLEAAYDLPTFTLVPNYPELRRLPAAAPRALRDRPGGEAIPAGAALVLYLGGLMADRGLEQLVDAMALITGPVSASHLVLLGEGVLGGTLRARARGAGIGDRVHILAPVPPDEVIAYAADATVGVSPIIASCLNYRFSLPNKLFQYMAAGLPVVASDFSQVREVVEDTGAGRCVNMADPSALARALTAVLSDRRDAAEMGQRGRRAVEEEFNWATSERALLELYAGIVGRIAGKGPSARLQSRP